MDSPVKPWHRGLTREAVARAALAVLDSGEPGALTMRRVARELDVTAPAIYAHVRSKDDLLDAALDVVLAEIEMPAAETDPRTALVAGFGSYREAFLQHPGAARLVTQRSRLSSQQVRLVEDSVRHFIAAGLELGAAVSAHVTTMAFTIGFIAQEVGRPPEPPSPELLGGQPFFRDIVAELAGLPVEERFRAGLTATLDGVLRSG